MKLENKIILILSPDNWGYLSLSKHNYAKELSKKNKVYFLEPFSDSKEVVTDQYRINILSNYTRVKGLSKLPRFLSRKLMKIEVKSILKQVEGNKIDLVWSFDSSRLFYLDLFKANKSIAHIMDFTENFNFKSLSESADICISVADCITDKMKKYNQAVFKIDHGFSVPLISSLNFKNIEKYSKTTGVYVGNLNMKYIDWECLYLLSNSNTNVDFNFFGPLSDETVRSNIYILKMKLLNNVFFKGYLESDLLNSELLKSSFCLVGYRYKDFGRQLDNSHKIMQYLGSGKPIFSSYTYEYRNTDLLFMYNDKDDVLMRFASFLNNEGNNFKQNECDKRIDYALNNSYENQVKKIEKILIG